MADDIRVKFNADASSYNKEIKNLAQQNKTLKSELDKVKSSTDENTTAQEKAAKIAEAVQKQVKGQEEYIKALKAQYDKLSQSEGDNTTELMKQEEKINKAETALNKMNEELSEAQKVADGYGDEAADAAKQTDVMDEAARTLAASKLADFYNALSEAAQKAASAAYDAAKELDEGYDTIIKKTGATGDSLKDLQNSADNVFGSLPADMDDVGTAIGEVNTRFGLTGKELEDVSTLFIKFANITDSDVNSAVSTTSRLLKTYGGNIKDADKLLGYFAKQSQQTGVDTNTLLQSLDKNGATLREMGLDLQQSTKLLALFEQNGVDSAGAMTGLRKAIVNGAKEGKSFDQVLKEASDSIKNAATDTDALQIATELFGSKGAVVMADGLRSGRISLDDLAESMETYGDVVGDTFEATLDPWDKSKQAMNNLKIAGKELAGEALSAIAPLLEKVVDVAQKAVKWFKNLPAPVKKTVAVIGLLAAGVGVVAPKMASLVQTLSMFKAANAIKGLTNVSKATQGIASGASKAGSAMSLLTNPVTLGAAAVGGLGLALAGLAKHVENTIEAEYGLTEAQKEQIKAAEEAAAAYEEQVAARQEIINGVQAEYDYIEDLAREYDTLIDANGKVKAGYEDRAEFILGELAKATDQTIDDIKKEIDQNGKLKDAIYDVIELKRAEATLSAYEADYADAKQKQAQAQQDYANAVATAADREKEYNKVMSGRAGEYVRQRNALQQQLVGLDKNSQAYSDIMMKISELDIAYTDERIALNKSKEAWDKSKAAVKDAESVMVGYNTTIKNYEGLSSAIISGDQKKIEKALRTLVNNMQTAETGTKESLEAQLQAAKDNLRNMEAAFANGKVDAAAVEMCRKLVDDAARELDKLNGVGKDAVDGLAEGIGVDSNPKIKARGKRLGQEAVKSVAKGAETASPSKATIRTGKDIGQGLISGMKEKERSAKTGGQNLGKAATGGVSAGATSASAKTAGQNIANNLKLGMDEKKAFVGSSAKGLANEATNKIKPDAAAAKTAGQSAGQGLADGINAKKGTVGTAADNVRKAADKAKPTYAAWKSVGENAAKGLGDGFKAQAKYVNSKVADVSMVAIKTGKQIMQIKSPSRVFKEIGEFAVEGLAIGLEETKPVEQAAAALARSAFMNPTLTFGAEGINGTATSNSFAYGDIVVNVSGANVQNEELLAKKISNEIFRQVKAERMAWA